MNIHTIIENSELLCNLFKNAPKEVLESSIVKEIAPDNLLISQGDYVDKIYLLCSGKVRMVNIFATGQVYEVFTQDNIQFIGEQSVLSQNRYATVTIETISSCVVMCIEKDVFLRWVKSDINIAFFLLCELSDRLYINFKKTGSNCYLSSEQILEKYLVSYYKATGKDTVIITESRQALSEQVGISLRSLVRAVSSLKAKSYINVKDRKIHISKKQYEEMSKNIDEI